MLPTSKHNLWEKTTAPGENVFYKCVTRVCLTFGTIFLVIAFFIALGFLMGVITVSFALPTGSYNTLWSSEIG